jgi:hypothetical protein
MQKTILLKALPSPTNLDGMVLTEETIPTSENMMQGLPSFQLLRPMPLFNPKQTDETLENKLFLKATSTIGLKKIIQTPSRIKFLCN